MGGQRQFKNRKSLTVPSAPADGDHHFGFVQVNSFHEHRDAEHDRLERQPKMVDQRRVEPGTLLGLVVGIDGGVLDEPIQPSLEERPAATPGSPS
jgi:hypothetical protein